MVTTTGWVTIVLLSLARRNLEALLLTRHIGRARRPGKGPAQRRSGVGRFRIAMAEGTVRRDLIADELLQLLDVGEAAFLPARPKQLSIELNFENAADCIRDEGHRAEL